MSHVFLSVRYPHKGGGGDPDWRSGSPGYLCLVGPGPVNFQRASERTQNMRQWARSLQVNSAHSFIPQVHFLDHHHHYDADEMHSPAVTDLVVGIRGRWHARQLVQALCPILGGILGFWRNRHLERDIPCILNTVRLRSKCNKGETYLHCQIMLLG